MKGQIIKTRIARLAKTPLKSVDRSVKVVPMKKYAAQKRKLLTIMYAIGDTKQDSSSRLAIKKIFLKVYSSF